MNSSSKNTVRYIIIRDDDTNALTPVECLERLYRPFLKRGMPVNLAVIPCVRTTATDLKGKLEGFLLARNGAKDPIAPLSGARDLVEYLHANPGFRILQHGCHHDPCEFDSRDPWEVRRRLDHGAQYLAAAGFKKPSVFVAPHDRFSRASFREVARRYQVVSSGWYEWRRLPVSWLPRYALKKARNTPHWRVGHTWLLSHPGCLLSRFRPRHLILDHIRQAVSKQSLTVLVTHWWEYFHDGGPDDAFIDVLHQTAEFLASDPDIKVISFSDLAEDSPLRPHI